MSKRTVFFAVLLIMFAMFFVSITDVSNNWISEANKNSNSPHRIPEGIDSS